MSGYRVRVRWVNEGADATPPATEDASASPQRGNDFRGRPNRQPNDFPSGQASRLEGVIRLADVLAQYGQHISVQGVALGADTVAVTLHTGGEHIS